MGIIATDLHDEMAADESIRIAAQRKNVVAIGWDPMEDKNMLEFSLGIKVDDDGSHIVHSVAAIVTNVFRKMAKDNIAKELELTASMMEVIAERQAERITASAFDKAIMDGVTS